MFWDSSALVSALAGGAQSSEMVAAFDRDATPVIWWTTPVECRSVVVRAVREKRTSREESSEAMERLREARAQSREILPVESVRAVPYACSRSIHCARRMRFNWLPR